MKTGVGVSHDSQEWGGKGSGRLKMKHENYLNSKHMLLGGMWYVGTVGVVQGYGAWGTVVRCRGYGGYGGGVRWRGTVGTVEGYGGYGGGVRWVRWMGAVGTVGTGTVDGGCSGRRVQEDGGEVEG